MEDSRSEQKWRLVTGEYLPLLTCRVNSPDPVLVILAFISCSSRRSFRLTSSAERLHYCSLRTLQSISVDLRSSSPPTRSPLRGARGRANTIVR